MEEDIQLTPAQLKDMKKHFEKQLFDLEHLNVDTMDDPAIYSNYWGEKNKDEPGIFVMVPGDAYDLLIDLMTSVGVTLRREGPRCHPEWYTTYDPTRDEPFFPLADLARAPYGLLCLPTLYVIVRNILDFVLQLLKLDKCTLLDFSNAKQEHVVRTFFSVLEKTGGSICAFELCVRFPRPLDFLLLFKKTLSQ